MSTRTPRLADVADLAGVSEATASRVVNGRSGVASRTRERVYDAIRELGYVRGPQVADVTHDRVGIVVPDLENPVFPRFARSLAGAFLASGFSPLFGLLSETMVETDVVASMRASRVAGIVFVAGSHATRDMDNDAADDHLDQYRRLLAADLPIVLVNGPVDGLACPMVMTDEHSAVRLAVDHLVDLGHRRIGLATGPRRYWTARAKSHAFTSLAESRGLDLAVVEHGLFTVGGGERAGARLLDAGVTGVVAGSDMIALGVIWAAGSRGMEVPDDLSVVGYDDSTIMAHVDPPLTTIRQDVDGICRHAAAQLLAGIAGRETHHDGVTFRPELILRSSTRRRTP